MKLPANSEKDRQAVATALRMVEQSRARMNGYSDEERHELEQRARASAKAPAERNAVQLCTRS